MAKTIINTINDIYDEIHKKINIQVDKNQVVLKRDNEWKDIFHILNLDKLRNIKLIEQSPYIGIQNTAIGEYTCYGTQDNNLDRIKTDWPSPSNLQVITITATNAIAPITITAIGEGRIGVCTTDYKFGQWRYRVGSDINDIPCGGIQIKTDFDLSKIKFAGKLPSGNLKIAKSNPGYGLLEPGANLPSNGNISLYIEEPALSTSAFIKIGEGVKSVSINCPVKPCMYSRDLLLNSDEKNIEKPCQGCLDSTLDKSLEDLNLNKK